MTKDNEIVVSIIMPAYNGKKYISAAINSVIDQSFQYWELIVIDDGSTDTTKDIVKSMQIKDNRIKYFYQENRKIGAARNTGLKLAKGLWIAFLDQDDLWMQEKLMLQMDFVGNNRVDFIYSDGYILRDATNELMNYPTISGWFKGEQMYQVLFNKNIIPVLSVLFKREWIKKVGYLDDDALIVGCDDWDYWLRAARAGAVFYGMPDKLFRYRIHINGTSQDNERMKVAEAIAIYKSIDYEVLTRTQVQKRFKALILPLLPKIFEKKKAFYAVFKILIKVYPLSIRYKFAYWLSHIIKNPNNKYFSFFTNTEKSLLSALKKGSKTILLRER